MAGWASEAQSKRITWDEWDADIVDKFLEWLYTDDYSVPYPRKVKSALQASQSENGENGTNGQNNEDFPYKLQEEEWRAAPEPQVFEQPAPPVAVEEPVEEPVQAFNYVQVLEADVVDVPAFPQQVDAQVHATEGPLTPLKDLTWKGSHAIELSLKSNEFDRWMDIRQESSEPLDYEATFMTHATLYVIACQKDLHELKNMAWQRLRSLLIDIGPPDSGERITANVVALIHYSYTETGVSELPQDPLRDLLTSYVAIHFTRFKGSEVDGLFASGDADDKEFVVDLMAKVRQRIEDLEAYRAPPVDSVFKKNKKGKKDTWFA